MMFTIARILCPVDFGSGSLRALDYSKALAARHSAQLVVLHVLPTAAAPTSDDDIEAELRQLVGAVSEEKFQIRSSRGDAGRRIVEAASEVRADMIIMAPRAEPVFERAPLGSVSHSVVISAPCPVCVISAFAAHLPTEPKHVLCPLDFASVDPALVDYATALAIASDARLTLIHIVDRHEEIAMGIATSRTTDELEQDALKRLARAAEPARSVGVDVDCQVEVGVASREILFTAQATQADLIVMGAQSRSGFELLQLGSTTHDVMCQALCPVVVLRP